MWYCMFNYSLEIESTDTQFYERYTVGFSLVQNQVVVGTRLFDSFQTEPVACLYVCLQIGIAEILNLTGYFLSLLVSIPVTEHLIESKVIFVYMDDCQIYMGLVLNATNGDVTVETKVILCPRIKSYVSPLWLSQWERLGLERKLLLCD